MKPANLVALAGLLGTAGASTALAHGQEMKFKVETTELEVGQSAVISIGLFERDGWMEPLDAARLRLANPTGIVRLEPLSMGSNFVNRFRMTALRPGACKVLIAFDAPCGCPLRQEFAFTVRAPRPSLAQIRLMRLLPGGLREDVTGRELSLLPGERAEIEAIGVGARGQPVPLAADLSLDRCTTGLRLEVAGANRVAIVADPGAARESAKLLAVDRNGSGISASAEMRVRRGFRRGSGLGLQLGVGAGLGGGHDHGHEHR